MDIIIFAINIYLEKFISWFQITRNPFTAPLLIIWPTCNLENNLSSDFKKAGLFSFSKEKSIEMLPNDFSNLVVDPGLCT